MKKSLVFCAFGLLAVGAGAQEVGRVISSVPVVQQVAVPRQVCGQAPVAVQAPNSGGGAVIGAIVGGILGNTIGHGTGRAVATGAGVVAGAAIGDSLEGRNAYAGVQQQCTTQTYYENRTVGYNVTYEYGGRQHTVQMPNDPGSTVRLQVTPVGAGSLPPVAPSGYGQPVITGPVSQAPMYVEPQPLAAMPPVIVPSTVVVPSSYYAPTYYAPAYRPFPVGLSLNFGYYGHRHGGYRHHHRGHRH